MSRPDRELLADLLMEKARRAEGVERWQQSLYLWTVRYRVDLKPGVRLDFKRHLYLRDLYTCKAREVVVYKAGQLGASEYAVSYALHAADQREATVLYVFPTDSHVSDFSAARFGPAIEASPYLDAIIVEGGVGGDSGQRKRGADRVTLKRVRDRFVYFRGAQVRPSGQAPQLKSIDADVLIFDELDEMDTRAPAIAEKRLGHSALKEIRWVSTPTYSEIGIHAKWLESDQREWHLKCPHCREWQPLTIEQVVTQWDALGRPVTWHGQEDGRAWVACRKCGAELDRLADGVWVPAFPERELVGFHLTKLFSATTALVEVVRALQTTDETKRKEAWNQDLGLPYTPEGGRMTDQVLDDCRRTYAHGPVQFDRPSMGVDVGKLLHVVIRGPAQGNGERPQRLATAVESVDRVADLIRQYRVRACVIDALPETTEARRLQAQFPGVVWLAYYVAQRTGTKRLDPVQLDPVNGVVNLDRTRTLDDTYARFYDQKATLPANARDVADYYDHLRAPVRILEDGPGGGKVARYVEASADHYAHAENYCSVAGELPGHTTWTATSYQG